MATTNLYSCAIIGGGLAGLCLAIQLADKGIGVIVFEKNEYPFHKVCGEYISMESWDFLNSLGLDLDHLDLPKITELGISSEQGFMLNATLPLGGFGISRYSLDEKLYQLALSKQVTILTSCKVQSVNRVSAERQEIHTSQGIYQASVVCGSYGKYTPLFLQPKHNSSLLPSKSANFIGVKYHIKTSLKKNRIELHNFKNGYCGVSKVDKDWYCLCYLASASDLQAHGNNLKRLEEQVLHKNPFLKAYFTESEFVNSQPLVISNVHFHKKQTYQQEVFLLGDAAGSITPLCGNGMSMGMKASKLLSIQLFTYFEKKQSRQQLVEAYERAWNQAFNLRIKSGYYLQNLFGKKATTHLALKVLDQFPRLTQNIISFTHGQPF